MQKLKVWAKRIAPYIFLILIPAANCYLLDFFTHNPFKTMAPHIHVMNLLLFFFMALFLFALTGRLRAALMIQTVFCAVYGLAGYFVLEFRGVPIQPWDLFSLDTAASVAGHYDYTLDRTAWIVLACFALLLVLEFFLKARLVRRPPQPEPAPAPMSRAKRKRLAKKGLTRVKQKPSLTQRLLHPWTVRLYLAVLSGLFLYGYTAMFRDEYTVENKLKMYDKLFTPTVIQNKNGTLTAFLMELQYISIDKPEGYSEERAQDLLTFYKPQESSADRRPNIIVIMNEAFSDPAVLGEFSTNEDYMPFVHSLLAGAPNTISGFANVSVKGGNTANTEFEYLTGNTMGFLPFGSIPYQQYIKEALPSMASQLKSLGYRTVAMHPYRAAGWDRDTVYPLLGFEELHFKEFFPNAAKVRSYVSDLADYEKIVEVFESKPDDEPLFLFNVTMQNHSSYSDWNKYDNFHPDITVDNSSSKLLPAYLSLMKLSDQAIEALVNYFSNQPEETILVFFGDHQPTDSIVNPVLKLHGTSCSELSEEEEYQRYKVPFFIWANYDIEERANVNTSANYLGVMTMKAADLPMSSYFNFLDALREEVPVISATHAELSDGTLTSVKNQQDLLSDYQTLQYYQLFP